jgi:hypothetical protein
VVHLQQAQGTVLLQTVWYTEHKQTSKTSKEKDMEAPSGGMPFAKGHGHPCALAPFFVAPFFVGTSFSAKNKRQLIIRFNP